jgi:hypothetical protein
MLASAVVLKIRFVAAMLLYDVFVTEECQVPVTVSLQLTLLVAYLPAQ